MATKTVLITGCSSGIGKALALEYAKNAYKVYATARSIEKIKDLSNKGICCLKMDVNNEQDVKQALADISNQGDVLDTLVNNAGFGLMAPMLDISPEDLQKQFETNLFAVSRLINLVVPEMIHRKSGTIINIGSVSGIMTTPFAGAYCASKAALHSISEAYRMELAPFGIKIIIVQPGAIASAFGDNSSAHTEGFISELSTYYPIANSIRRRARASQERPTSAQLFAQQLLKQSTKKNPAFVLRIGNGSFILPLLVRVLPSGLLDKILAKPFQLSKLSN